MKFAKRYKISNWMDWNSQLSENIEDFFLSFSIFPNILEANPLSYSQIDFLVNVVPDEKNKLHRKDDFTNQILRPRSHENVGITAYSNDCCMIDFAINENLKDKEFKLVFESNPDWGDEENTLIPVDQLEKVIFQN